MNKLGKNVYSVYNYDETKIIFLMWLVTDLGLYHLMSDPTTISQASEH